MATPDRPALTNPFGPISLRPPRQQPVIVPPAPSFPPSLTHHRRLRQRPAPDEARPPAPLSNGGVGGAKEAAPPPRPSSLARPHLTVCFSLCHLVGRFGGATRAVSRDLARPRRVARAGAGGSGHGGCVTPARRRGPAGWRGRRGSG